MDSMFSLAEASNSLSWQDIQRMPLPEREAYAVRLDRKLHEEKEALEAAKRGKGNQ